MNYTSHDRELSFEVFHHDNLKGFRSDWAYPRLSTPSSYNPDRGWKIKQQYADELAEDVEVLAAVLAELGVTVHRPLQLPASAEGCSFRVRLSGCPTPPPLSRQSARRVH